jgi:hypothetical protein
MTTLQTDRRYAQANTGDEVAGVTENLRIMRRCLIRIRKTQPMERKLRPRYRATDQDHSLCIDAMD